MKPLSPEEINTIIKDINRQREVMHELVDRIIIEQKNRKTVKADRDRPI